MQFSHVNDMSTEEILDYAVLYGNTTCDLNIKSFTNLEVRDFSENDWIAIFLDLMVFILDVENPLMLRSQPATKGIFFLCNRPYIFPSNVFDTSSSFSN